MKRPTVRPEYSFFLTETGHEALPKNYGRLLDSLFQEVASLEKTDIEGKEGEELTKFLLSRMAQRVADRTNVSPDDDMSQCTATLTALLEEEQFTLHIQKKGGTLKIELLNCHFRSVAMEHGAICSFDSSLIAQVLGTPVSLEKCVSWGDTTGDHLLIPIFPY